MRLYCLYLIHTTAYHSYNRPNGYNAFAFPFSDNREGPSTATIAMKCNSLHVRREGEPFLMLRDLLSNFCIFLHVKKEQVSALLSSLKRV